MSGAMSVSVRLAKIEEAAARETFRAARWTRSVLTTHQGRSEKWKQKSETSYMLAQLVVDIVERERRGVAAATVMRNRVGRGVLSCRAVEILPSKQVFRVSRAVW